MYLTYFNKFLYQVPYLYIDEKEWSYIKETFKKDDVRESLATATLDCDGGLGIIIAPKAMYIAIEKARHTGMGMVTMRNGRHLGISLGIRNYSRSELHAWVDEQYDS